jgi:hypothetical protein
MRTIASARGSTASSFRGTDTRSRLAARQACGEMSLRLICCHSRHDAAAFARFETFRASLGAPRSMQAENGPIPQKTVNKQACLR